MESALANVRLLSNGTQCLLQICVPLVKHLDVTHDQFVIHFTAHGQVALLLVARIDSTALASGTSLHVEIRFSTRVAFLQTSLLVDALLLVKSSQLQVVFKEHVFFDFQSNRWNKKTTYFSRDQ